MKKTVFVLLILALVVFLLVACPRKKDGTTAVTLTMLEPLGNGSVTPVVGNHDYLEGSVVNLTAEPAEGWEFEKWEVDGEFYSDEEVTTLTMDSDKSVQALFAELPAVYTLDMLEPEGEGTVDPDVGEHTYVEGTVADLLAEPDEGWEFEKWEVDGEFYSDEAETEIEMDADKIVKAFFAFAVEIPQYTIRVKAVPPIGGEVQINGRGFKAEDEVIVDAGQEVQIIAQEFEGWEFLGWFEEEEGVVQLTSEAFCDEAECEFVVEKDLSLVAHFDANALGDSEWEVEANLRECPWWEDDPTFVGEGTVTITEDPVRLVGTAFVELQDLEGQELVAMIRGIILFFANTFSDPSPSTSSSDFRTVAIPEENVVEMQYTDFPELRVDYDITFHDFDLNQPEETARTWAELIFKWGSPSALGSDMQMKFAVEVIGESLQPNHVVFIAEVHDDVEGYEPMTGELTVISIRKAAE